MPASSLRAHLLFLPLAWLATGAAGQSSDNKKPYGMGATELIFSFGDVSGPGFTADPVVRFSGFFHFQEQIHFDFSKNAGLYTGYGVRNVGFINKLNDSVRVKQRSYSFGVPLALKFGNMEKQVWLALGGEAEFMFAYKQKVFYAGEKFKDHEWFSDKVNLFNPSLFAEIHFKGGGYIRFRYYLDDFLRPDKQDIRLFGDSYPYFPEKSTLMYIGIGTAVKNKDAKRRLNRNRET
jgi:hypothetical protein